MQCRRGDAVGSSEGHELIFSGKAHVVTRFAQRVVNRFGVKGSGPRGAHLSPAVIVAQYPYANAGRRGRRQLFYFSLKGPNFSIDAAREVNLDFFGPSGRLKDAFGLGEQFAHDAVPPMVMPLRRIVACPQPTGTLWPSLPHVPGIMEKSRATASTRCSTSGPLPMRLQSRNGAVI